MGCVLQSGNVTPGHLAQFITDHVIGDAGPILASQKVLGAIFGADFNTTSDQPIVLPSSINAFQLTGIIVTNASISLTTAFGGFYPLTSKAGSPIVSASQGYSALTSSSVLLQPTLTTFAMTTRFSNAILTNLWAIYFSLTIPQGATASADVYAIGLDLSP